MGIVAGSRLEQRKYRQIVIRVGGSEHIEVIAVEKRPRLESQPISQSGWESYLLQSQEEMPRSLHWHNRFFLRREEVTTGVPLPESASSEGVSSPLSTDSFKNSC